MSDNDNLSLSDVNEDEFEFERLAQLKHEFSLLSSSIKYNVENEFDELARFEKEAAADVKRLQLQLKETLNKLKTLELEYFELNEECLLKNKERALSIQIAQKLRSQVHDDNILTLEPTSFDFYGKGNVYKHVVVQEIYIKKCLYQIEKKDDSILIQLSSAQENVAIIGSASISSGDYCLY